MSADFGGFWKEKDKETQKGDVYSTIPRVKYLIKLDNLLGMEVEIEKPSSLP